MIVYGSVILLHLMMIEGILCQDTNYHWSKWTQERRECNRTCSQKFGLVNETRHCIECRNAFCDTALESKCRGKSQRLKKCYIGSQCVGSGLYTGTWSEWSIQSPKCPIVPDNPCKNRKEKYVKACQPSALTQEKFKCGSYRKLKKSKTVKCPCVPLFTHYLQQARKYLLKPPPSAWTTWSLWGCIDGCEVGGKGFRTRQCMGTKTSKKMCRGDDREEMENCETLEACHGKNLSVTKASLEKKNITSRKLRNELLLYYNKTCKNYNKEEKASVTMDCPINLVKLVQAEFPKSTIEWRRNDKPLVRSNRRIEVTDTSLKMTQLVTNDTGVYFCEARISPNQSLVLDFFTLAVTSVHPQRHAHDDGTLKVVCNGIYLQDLVDRAEQMWFIGNRLYRAYGEVDLARANVHYAQHCSSQYEGVWKCVIKDLDSDRNWTTNCFKVNIVARRQENVLKSSEKTIIPLLAFIIFLMIFKYQFDSNEPMHVEDLHLWESRNLLSDY